MQRFEDTVPLLIFPLLSHKSCEESHEEGGVGGHFPDVEKGQAAAGGSRSAATAGSKIQTDALGRATRRRSYIDRWCLV